MRARRTRDLILAVLAAALIVGVIAVARSGSGSSRASGNPVRLSLPAPAGAPLSRQLQAISRTLDTAGG